MTVGTHTLRMADIAVATLLALAPVAALAEEEEEPFDEAEIFFELNNTDGDLGIHAKIDGDAWKWLRIEDPFDRYMLAVVVQGRLRRQGLTELFFESAEPDFDELPPEEFFSRFPAGIYEIEGVTLEGDELESEVEISHVMPAPADNILISGVAAVENCDVEPLPTVAPPIVISWDPVTSSHPDLGEEGDIEIANYELVVEIEAGNVLTAILPPSVTAMEIPAAFVALADSFKFEILARAENGNRTAVESCFDVE